MIRRRGEGRERRGRYGRQLRESRQKRSQELFRVVCPQFETETTDISMVQMNTI